MGCGLGSGGTDSLEAGQHVCLSSYSLTTTYNNGKLFKVLYVNTQIQAGHLETVHSSQWFLQGAHTANAFQKPNQEMELGPKLRGDASSLPIFFLERNKAL